ncbi:aminopeptidase [Oscillospiraceae bacterium MB08-C2-2]|nr:aminopeptidase [Oscillospiraceae bacterium MB08-C2-2]
MDMEQNKKTPAELLGEKVLFKPENNTILMTDEEIDEAFRYCEGYKTFLDKGKTEREAVSYAVSLLEERGFSPFDPAVKYQPGSKVYLANRGKALLFAVIGKKPLDQGVRILASHVDSPRIDLKPRPVYEEAQLAMFKTHYYGGVRKYQWVATPLALHGVVIKKDGTKVEIVLGEDVGDPVFCITDLLPHLSQEQNKRTLADGIKGEELNILIGSRSFRDDKASEKVKLNILGMLYEKYGIVEADFLSADLSLVPAHKALDVGFDRSMLGAYGQDDRVCAYGSLQAALAVENPAYTTVTVLADREEIGSDGNTGLASHFLEDFIADLASPWGIAGRTVLNRSQCLSADVNVAFDPTFPEVTEKRNTAYLNYGVCLTKYTGSRGKSGTSEATAEFMGKIRGLFDREGVLWQTGLLGKVDQGGGGTVAKFIANLGVDVVDIGVAVLSMHAPFEVVSKTDVYNMYKGFVSFYKDDSERL